MLRRIRVSPEIKRGDDGEEAKFFFSRRRRRERLTARRASFCVQHTVALPPLVLTFLVVYVNIQEISF